MLHFMFGEPERELDGPFAEACQLMDRFAVMMAARIRADGDPSNKLRKFEVWTYGLRSSLTELEQSQYAASRFKDKISSTSVEGMTAEERMDYARYVYFDKNSFIRVFSLLDKLGTFLNELLDMRTEKIKPHFSYFTVLRNMRERKAHPELTWKLNDIKEQGKESMNRLRKRRNMEIHYMNSEMQDDLIQSQRMYGEEIRLENIELQALDLSRCLYMSIESLRLTYLYAGSLMRK
ncbi:Cthe_2314 family HEPN domain-containing protein [Paenibacillus sp. GCM10027627]|uniref:Cthe_2314 family HEPN domain-containing protein n=1 Tax=unclassified Paenibacillus TaxID=185978 RepID=UPI0036422E5B